MGITFTMPPPKKVATPYGGRLIWTLPGGNQLIAHLKDKAVIRHRKRWSQVTYHIDYSNKAAPSESMSSSMRVMQIEIYPTQAQRHTGICFPLIDSLVSKNSVSEQWMP